MTLKEQIEAYKAKHPNREHTFSNGVKTQRLHYWLDLVYSNAIEEFKKYGTQNDANYLKELLK